MPEQKTKPTAQSVSQFLKAVPDPDRRKDCQTLIDLMKKITKDDPAMWGAGMIGFGKIHYRYASGHEGDMFKTGFAPRKDAITVYAWCQLDELKPYLAKLGKFKAGKGCLYIKRLEDVDLKVLGKLITESIKLVTAKYAV